MLKNWKRVFRQAQCPSYIQELVLRSAFFKSVSGNLTNHYKLCRSFDGHISEDRSAQTQAYFQEGKYATGYATHGLFPYRGKFHPQLIKGLLNIFEIKQEDIVLARCVEVGH